MAFTLAKPPVSPVAPPPTKVSAYGQATAKTLNNGTGLSATARSGDKAAVGSNSRGALIAAASGKGQAFASDVAAGARMDENGALISLSGHKLPALSVLGGGNNADMKALTTSGLVSASTGFVAAQNNASAKINKDLREALVIAQSDTVTAQIVRKGKDICVESTGTAAVGVTDNTMWAIDGDNIAIAHLGNEFDPACNKCKGKHRNFLRRSDSTGAAACLCDCHRARLETHMTGQKKGLLKY
ncbi:hypothetical protein B0T24DRAFT_588029 [Lasiosphaeria ovina]|uniref:Uncharacterized protein n=1 Tax=Lasiosphaeria ovina TaxID=92902 RepID=A0AAE0NKR6_9PEZI|nr:hypothetical protein B0T24DRAFT_588029 [Lasiosphaeria ovina]